MKDREGVSNMAVRFLFRAPFLFSSLYLCARVCMDMKRSNGVALRDGPIWTKPMGGG